MVGRLGRHDRALEYADRALALDPELVEAHLHKGKAARALGKKEIVREVCAALAAIEPEKFCRARRINPASRSSSRSPFHTGIRVK